MGSGLSPRSPLLFSGFDEPGSVSPRRSRDPCSLSTGAARLVRMLVRADDTRFTHRLRIWVRGSTPLGRANFFKRLLNGIAVSLMITRFCRPNADPPEVVSTKRRTGGSEAGLSHIVAVLADNCRREDRFGRLQRRAAMLNRQLGGEGWGTWDIPPKSRNGCVGGHMRGNSNAGSKWSRRPTRSLRYAVRAC